MNRNHRTLSCALAACLAFCFAASVARAALTGVGTSDDAGNNLTRLEFVSLSDGRSQGAGLLVGIDLFHFGSAGATTVLIGPTESGLPAVGSRATFLDGDNALNTGVINPGTGTGVAAGVSPTAALNGIGINFATPIVNGPGDDFVFFELQVGAGQAPDNVVISALTGGTGFASTSTGSLLYTSAAYPATVNQRNAQTITMAGGAATLSDLETKVIAGAGSNSTDAFYAGFAVDLSTLGVAPGAAATGLFIQADTSGGSSTVDPVFIAGLTPTQAPSGAGLIAVNTANVGGLTNVTSIVADRGTGAKLYTVDSLVSVDVFHFHATGSASVAIAATAAGDPGAGNRATLIDGDVALNTGMINPLDPGVLSVAQQASLGPSNSTIEGLGVTFAGGLVNREGIDLIVAELAGTGAQDGFRINRIDGVVGSLIVDASDYNLAGANASNNTVNASGASLVAFEAGGFPIGGTTGQGWAAVGIDLSDLGYALGDVVPGLLFSDAPGQGVVDFVFIAGLPAAPIPEPMTGALLLVAIGAVTMRRRRAA